jgi:hypothetical protein
MNTLDIIVLVLAWALTLPYVCRLSAMNPRKHRGPMIMLHLVLFWGAMAAGVHAWQGVTDMSDVCVVAAAALWIAVSYPTWRAGVPQYQERFTPLAAGLLARAKQPERYGGTE